MNLEEKRRVLRRLAREQGGFFTAGQAEAVGFPRSRHPGLVGSGQWERVRRGIFRLASEPEGQFFDLHVLSLFFRHRDGTPSGVFGLETAAAIFEMGDMIPVQTTVLVPRGFRKRAAIPDGVELVEASDITREVVRHEGLFVTSPVRTIVDLLCEASRDQEETRRTFVAACGAGLISPAAMHALRDWAPHETAERMWGWSEAHVPGGMK